MQVLNYIEHMNDSPRSIPPRELARLIYGPGSVYARQPTAQQVQLLANSSMLTLCRLPACVCAGHLLLVLERSCGVPAAVLQGSRLGAGKQCCRWRGLAWRTCSSSLRPGSGQTRR